MKLYYFDFWFSLALSILFIVWGAYEFANSTDHKYSRLLFIVGVILGAKAAILFLFNQRMQRKKSG